MKRELSILGIILSVVFILCGCTDEEDIRVEKSIMKTLDYQAQNRVRTENYQISLPEHASMNSFYIYGNQVYYSVDYSSYFDPTIESLQFEEIYRTQIRMYDASDGRDILLYQYDSDDVVTVTDIQSNGSVVIWEDYDSKDGEWNWNLHILNLVYPYRHHVFGGNDFEKDVMESITPTLTEDAIYWYGKTSDETHPFSLYQYDLESEEISIVQKQLDLASPYEHVNLAQDTISMYQFDGEDGSEIYIWDRKKDRTITLKVEFGVCDPVSDGTICVWTESYDNREELFVYDLEHSQAYCLPCDYIQSYVVIDGNILVKQESGIYIYNCNDNICHQMISAEEIEYGYLYFGLEDSAFAEKREMDGMKKELIKFTPSDEE